MALVTNGTNQYASANLTTLVNAANEFSVAFTFKTGATVTGVRQSVFCLTRSSSYLSGIALAIRTDGKIVVISNGNGSDTEGSGPFFGVTAAPNTSYRCVITKAAGATGAITGYLDVITTTYSRASVSSTRDLTRISLGVQLNTPLIEFFGGKTTRFAFWPSVLSTADINVCLNPAQTPADCAVAPQDYWAAFSSDAPTIGSNSLTRFNSAAYDSDLIVPPTISTVNDGNPIEFGQTGVTADMVGYSGTPTSGSIAYSGGTVAISNIVGSSTSITFDVAGRTDGAAYPLSGTDGTLSLTYTTETAAKSTSLVKPSAETRLTFEFADTTSPNSIAYPLAQAGYTPEGGEICFTPYGDFDLDPEDDGTTDGIYTVSTGGTINGWFRPVTGTGAGNVYQYTVTITESGAVVVTGGLTSSGLTSSGLTRVGLTSSGL